MAWWTWWRRGEPPNVQTARERLESAEADDERIASLERRTERIRRENNLAPWIMKSLGIRP